jgi:hypothetical protein
MSKATNRWRLECDATGIWKWPGQYGGVCSWTESPIRLIVLRLPDTGHPFPCCDYCRRTSTHFARYVAGGSEWPPQTIDEYCTCTRHTPRLVKECREDLDALMDLALKMTEGGSDG